MRRVRHFDGLAVIVVCACTLLAETQPAPVTVQVDITNPKAARKSSTDGSRGDLSNVVIWLTPIGASGVSATGVPPAHSAPQIAQIDKSLDPHVLVVQAGTGVQFPNR